MEVKISTILCIQITISKTTLTSLVCDSMFVNSYCTKYRPGRYIGRTT